MRACLLVSCTFAVALNVTALTPLVASDLSPDEWWARRGYPMPEPPPLPRYSWTGCHLGAHFGGGFGNDTVSGVFTAFIPETRLTVIDGSTGTSSSNFITPSGTVALNNNLDFSPVGILGGGQGGCDYQVAPTWVIGVDADASGANITGSHAQTLSNVLSTLPPSLSDTTTVNSSGTLSGQNNFITTATGRLGYTFGDLGRVMFYGKGGVAWVSDKYNFSGQVASTSCNRFFIPPLLSSTPPSCILSNPTATTLFNFSASESRVGWTVGVGIEWAIIDHWSAKFEYDYLNFGSRNLTFNDPMLGGATMSINQQINEVKLGFNYLFGPVFPY
jgi:outer membrane immunogenic protein